ncbi:hypothetical protein Agub_g3322 [Astrephomene gubernaculifera]|uniref:Oxidation resistance protein 1 n=1 Tax=Astrephomene gubernaculifera TaxID=47775 RepID=A0AAD3DIE6_9CHLO|nr:hypothetical protein Agub_g3322 [Astrephomene gubernaculifera]
MDGMNPSQLKTILEDTQASLAAALGRIEAFRIREKQIMSELTQLRQQVHGAGQSDQQSSAPQPVGGAKPAAIMPASQPAYPATPSPAVPAQAAQPTKADYQPAWTSPSSQPVYITNCDGDYPIHLINGSKKVPGSLIVTPEYVDFVEVRARIRQEDFVGISTVKTDARPKKRSGGSLFLCCAAPPPAGDADGRSAAAAAGCKGQDEAAERGTQEGTSSSGGDGGGGGGSGVWQMLWSAKGVPQRQVFEASHATREALHRHTQRWLGEVEAEGPPGEPTAAGDDGAIEIAVPRNLTVTDASLRLLGEPSLILNDSQTRALASAIPPLERMRDWSLSYSTAKHGISLQTLYRKAVSGMPTILLIRDFGGYTFGCYTPDSWRIAPRYYGSGETFVFQLEPYRVAYPWRSLSKLKNDYFQYGTPECLAVGGLGHFAIWVDSELHSGSSGICGTFGSPCLATNEEFKVQYVEMWQALG